MFWYAVTALRGDVMFFNILIKGNIYFVAGILYTSCLAPIFARSVFMRQLKEKLMGISGK